MAALREQSLPQEGDTFDSFEEVEYRLTLLGLVQNFSPGITHSDQERMIWNCRSSKTCLWRARAWKGNGSLVKLSVLGGQELHTCAGQLVPSRPAHSKNAFLVRILPQHMTITSETKEKEISDCLKKNYNITVSKHAVYKAKSVILSQGDADLTAQVQKLPSLFSQMRSKDPDTVAILDTRVDKTFRRCLLIPGPARHAFQSCRPIVALDGTFLKSKMKGTLLLAAGFDGNNSLLILAWAIVSAENADNWIWFVQHLCEAIPEINHPSATVISDRDKGLLGAISSQVPGAHQAYCCYHMASNLKNHFGKSTQADFWRAVYAPSKDRFDAVMKSIRNKNTGAADYLMQPEQDHSRWASYAFAGLRWGLVTSNLAEIANSLLVPIRRLGYLDVMLSIYEHQQTKYYERSKEAQLWKGAITPKANFALRVACEEGKSMNVLPASLLNGTVKHQVGQQLKTFTVSIFGNGTGTGECSCGEFQQMFRPCSHAAAFSTSTGRAPLELVHFVYSKEIWMKTYSKAFCPLSDFIDEDLSGTVTVPLVDQIRGRRQSKRKEKGSQPSKKTGQGALCSICGEEGHTKKTCAGIYMSQSM